MPAQNNPGQQFDRRHAVTIEATVALAAARLIAYDGGYATSAGGLKDCQGVSQMAAAVGEALPLTTHYSELVECSAAVAFGDWIKPAADGTGRAAVGSRTDNCGRALGATSAAGQLVEVQLLKHVQP